MNTRLMLIGSICFWGCMLSAMEMPESNNLITVINGSASCKTVKSMLESGLYSSEQIEAAIDRISQLPQNAKLVRVQAILAKSQSPRRDGEYLYKELAAFHAQQVLSFEDEGKESSSEEESE